MMLNSGNWAGFLANGGQVNISSSVSQQFANAHGDRQLRSGPSSLNTSVSGGGAPTITPSGGVAPSPTMLAGLMTQQSLIPSTPAVLKGINGGRSVADKIKDFWKNRGNWIKIGQKLDPKQPKNGISMRETWRNKVTGEMMERHILERNGKSAKNHPHFHEPK